MKNGEKVYIIIEDYDNDQTINVACFGTEEEADEFCNTHKHHKLVYEEWYVGEVMGGL